jgi:hypothetical protein
VEISIKKLDIQPFPNLFLFKKNQLLIPKKKKENCFVRCLSIDVSRIHKKNNVKKSIVKNL